MHQEDSHKSVVASIFSSNDSILIPCLHYKTFMWSLTFI